MSDPINDLENFNSEGLPVNPLAPSEVRRLGDRMRRRRNVTAAVAGVAAVAVIAAPIALFAGRDNSSAPAPDPTTSTTGSPDVTPPPSEPEPEPINVLVKEIPQGFPLAAGWPVDSMAESEDDGLSGPNRTLDSLLLVTSCGDVYDQPEYVDRLRAQWTNPEDYRGRQLTTYPDANAAVADVDAIANFFRRCAESEGDDGYRRVTRVLPTDVGGQSWAVVTHYEFHDAPAIGLTIIHVARLGRSVLIETSSNEGSLADSESQLEFMTSNAAKPLSRMCVFTEAGCADGTEPIQPR
jgi:hypothetical protein